MEGGEASSEGSRVWVAVRCRPFSQRERAEGDAETSAVTCIGNSVHFGGHEHGDMLDLERHREAKEFAYDHVFGGSSLQEDVFNAVGAPLVDNALNAYNGCIFAYGQTGSGKSHSVVGDLSSDMGKGIQPRACQRLFKALAQRATADSNARFTSTVLASYLEIYNEKLFDLLSGGKDGSEELQVRLHPNLGPIVTGLTECPIQTFDEARELFDYGAKRRAVGATQMNDTSSRSHAIFTLQIRMQVSTPGKCVESQAKIHFVDLAGSERQKKTGATGTRLKEGIGINQSLSTLARVISELSSKGSKALPPFRESKLTLLLKDALMGNSRTQLLACISPAKSNLAETISTLEFASRCKLVKTIARRNEQSRADVIAKLTSEKEQIASQLKQEQAKSEDLCRQLQAEIEKAESSEKTAETVMAEKRQIEKKLHELECERDDLVQQQSTMKETLSPKSEKNRQSLILQDEIAMIEEQKQREVWKHEELRAQLERELTAQHEREQDLLSQMDALRSVQDVWELDQARINERREEQFRSREAELSRMGMHLAGISPEDMASAPRIVNLHPDPSLKGCLVYYLPVGESRLGSETERCQVCLSGPGINAEICVLTNEKNQRLLISPINGGLVRVNGRIVDQKGQAVQDGDRLAVGRAYIFQVQIPAVSKVNGMGDGSAQDDFDQAVEEICACAEVDPEWENGLQKAMKLVKSDFGNEAANKLLQQAKEASEKIALGNQLLADIPEERREGIFCDISKFELSIMFDAHGLPEVCVVARQAPSIDADSLEDFIQERPPSVVIWELKQFQREQLVKLQENARSSKVKKLPRKVSIEIEQVGVINTVTWYKVHVKENGDETIYKMRYSDFESLDQSLRLVKPHMAEAMPELPPKGWFGIRQKLHISKDFDTRRLDGLKKYLEALAIKSQGPISELFQEVGAGANFSTFTKS